MTVTHGTQQFGNAFLKPPHKSGPAVSKFPAGPKGAAPHSHERKPPTYTKIFRWRLPDGQTQEPAVVEVVGTFTNWQKVPLIHDGVRGGWHVTIHHIQGNRTHHYMLLADGQPVADTHCDGMAIPASAQEAQYQLTTARGPRVCMLFAQAK